MARPEDLTGKPAEQVATHRPRVVVIDRRPKFRKWEERLFPLFGVDVVGALGTFREARALVEDTRPDAVLVQPPETDFDQTHEQQLLQLRYAAGDQIRILVMGNKVLQQRNGYLQGVAEVLPEDTGTQEIAELLKQPIE